MDSLRIILLIIGAIFVAAIYGWERVKRRKKHDRYAKWGVSDESETHIIGRNSGDPETDSQLVSTAYETDQYVDNIHDDQTDNEPLVEFTSDEPEPLADDLQSNEDEDWQSEVTASLDEDTFTDETEPDLDSDPELVVNPIDDITSELEALEEIISHESGQDEMDLGDLDVSDESTSSEPEQIIAIHVLAHKNSSFAGADILNNLVALNLQYDERNTFHRVDDNSNIIFSMANAVEPGTFDIDAMEAMSTPALLFILALPNSTPALEAYNSMLDTARSLADSLNGRLCDETRSVLTRQAIDARRSELNTL